MRRKLQVIRHSEVVVYTALSFILGTVFMSLLRQLTGWTDTEWSRISQICVYAGLVALWASFFCKVYDTVEGMLQMLEVRRKRLNSPSVTVSFWVMIMWKILHLSVIIIRKIHRN